MLKTNEYIKTLAESIFRESQKDYFSPAYMAEKIAKLQIEIQQLKKR